MMYAKRDAWPKSRLKPKFFGGMCTTQCVECMNKFVKDCLRKDIKLFECIPPKIVKESAYNFENS